MLTISRKKHGIEFIDCWYADESLKKKGIIRYYQSVKPMGKKTESFDTLLTDLTESEEEIIARFAKNCKYKVNRAPREGVTVTCTQKQDITDEKIQEFVIFYSEFYASKGYESVNQEKLTEELKRYRDAGALSIHVAYLNDIPVVYHTHVITDKYARLFHSASLYRVIEGVNPNVVGMANRYLHKVDMLQYKDMGIDTYDWGGAGKGEEVANITEFKESFGGTPAVFYHGEEVRGLKAKLFKMLISFL